MEKKWAKHWYQTLIQIKQDLVNYIKVVPVLGYNSGHYDINLAKQNLIHLIHYNELDVIPFSVAVNHWLKKFHLYNGDGTVNTKEGVDVLKTTIRIPGVARQPTQLQRTLASRDLSYLMNKMESGTTGPGTTLWGDQVCYTPFTTKLARSASETQKRGRSVNQSRA